MPTLAEQRAALVDDMEAIVDRSRKEHRDLTAAEAETIELKAQQCDDLRAREARAKKSQSTLDSILSLGHGDNDDGTARRTLALSGTSAKSAALRIAGEMREYSNEHGAKALVPTGTITTSVPLAPEVVGPPRTPPTLTQVFGVEPAPATYAFMRQTLFTNAAAIVASGALKPTSVINIERVQATLEVIAHLSEPIDKFLLEDSTNLGVFIQRQLFWGVEQRLEKLIVDTIESTTGVLDQAFVSDPLVTLRAAVTLLEVGGYAASAIALNPTDYGAAASTRNASGAFDLGSAVDAGAQRVWGLPVALSANIAAGTGYVIDGNAGVVRTDQRGIVIAWDGAGDLFTKNELRARAEGRFHVDIELPGGIAIAHLAAVTP